jgi:hypothetical protein
MPAVSDGGRFIDFLLFHCNIAAGSEKEQTMATGDMEKLILLHLTPDTWWTVEALRERIMQMRIEADDWPLKAQLVAFLFGMKAALYVGGVPTPIYFRNAFEALHRKDEVEYDPKDPAKGWRITRDGLIRQKLIQLEEAEKEREPFPAIH